MRRARWPRALHSVVVRWLTVRWLTAGECGRSAGWSGRKRGAAGCKKP